MNVVLANWCSPNLRAKIQLEPKMQLGLLISNFTIPELLEQHILEQKFVFYLIFMTVRFFLGDIVWSTLCLTNELILARFEYNYISLMMDCLFESQNKSYLKMIKIIAWNPPNFILNIRWSFHALFFEVYCGFISAEYQEFSIRIFIMPTLLTLA